MRVPPSWAIETINVRRCVALDVVLVVPVRIELELEAEGREEALDAGVVPAVALATHARRDAMAREQRAVLRTRTHVAREIQLDADRAFLNTGRWSDLIPCPRSAPTPMPKPSSTRSPPMRSPHSAG